MAPLKQLRLQRKISERSLAMSSGLSRVTLRNIEALEKNITLSSLNQFAQALDRDLIFLMPPKEECNAELSTFSVSEKVIRDGDPSWKIHFMELVDEFRKSLDSRLLLLPPSKKLSVPLKALLASIVKELSHEAGMDCPSWALKSFFLESPWFVAGVESLKATALLETPLSFRANNIFVQENFLSRV